MRLLLIEDDLQAAEYLVKRLRENGYEVEHSADGRDGLERVTARGTTSSSPTDNCRMWTVLRS